MNFILNNAGVFEELYKLVVVDCVEPTSIHKYIEDNTPIGSHRGNLQFALDNNE